MDKLSSSERINTALKKLGIFSLYDVINLIPYRYENFSLSNKDDLKDKSRIVLYGRIISPIEVKKANRVTVVKFTIESHLKISIGIIGFNMTYISKTYKQGDYVTISGIYNQHLNQLNLSRIIRGEVNDGEVIKPLYKLNDQIENYEYVRIVKKALTVLKDNIYSIVPYYFQNKYHLVNIVKAYQLVHFPQNVEDVKKAYLHLKYQEALLFCLKSQIIHHDNKALKKYKKEAIGIELCDDFIASLPFVLTDEQYQNAKEIIDDMNDNSLMYRMLQGDVGSGKTVVSFVCLYANYKRGDQGALMAPTDALAKQHYENAKKMFEGTEIRIALLVGSTSIREKNEIYQDLADGSIDIVIGTHALFSKSVIYSSLGLVIIDEQHRFGVNQRSALVDKGNSADLLMMSATPIPRSLALTIYGDLDISLLHSFPNKERNIVTRIVSSDDEIIIKGINYNLANNKVIYIVAPLIEESDSSHASVNYLFDKYNALYPNKVGLLHGNLKNEEKDLVLNNFKNGITPILVSTQVIEVGIDVKNATLMVIYNANNFGLASLHQLRGRIGRDGTKAVCFLVSDDEDNERLNVLVNSNDGFEIAEADLKNRGPGELLGLRQSGLPSFRFLNVVNDLALFNKARDDAKYILANQDKKEFEYIIKRAKKEIATSTAIKS